MGGVSNFSNVDATNSNDEIIVDDSLNRGGVDTVLNLTITPQLGKVGATVLTDRKYVMFQALDNNLKWGLTSSTQSFNIFKNQIITLALGPNTEIWFKTSSGVGDLAFSEIA